MWPSSPDPNVYVPSPTTPSVLAFASQVPSKKARLLKVSRGAGAFCANKLQVRRKRASTILIGFLSVGATSSGSAIQLGISSTLLATQNACWTRLKSRNHRPADHE